MVNNMYISPYQSGQYTPPTLFDVEFPSWPYTELNWPYKPWYKKLTEPQWTTTVTVAEEPMNDLTDITVLIDESGSMESKRTDVLGGYNGFLKEQREIEKPCKLSLVTFNNRTKIVTAAADLKHALALTPATYQPAGGTALLDALKIAIDAATERAMLTRPSKMIFVIFTDGEENSSKYANLDQIKELVKRKQLAGWEFVFMGADIDAFTVGSSIGASYAYTAQVASHKMPQAYAAMSGNVSMLRSGNKLDASFTAEQQDFLSKN